MAKGKTATPAAPAVPLSWPTIPPPSSTLSLAALDTPGLLIIDNLFPPALRKHFITFVDSLSLSQPVPPKRGEAERRNERFQVQDDAFAGRLWRDSGLSKVCESIEGRNGRKPCGLNGNIRIYRYPQGSFFGPHYDDDCQSNGAVSEWTLLIYLTGKEDGVVGGETAFYPNPSRKGNGPAIVPELLAGRALLHRHGQLCSLHEGRLVEKGTKYVLRSDVMFR